MEIYYWSLFIKSVTDFQQQQIYNNRIYNNRLIYNNPLNTLGN